MSKVRFVVGEDKLPSSLETFRRTVEFNAKRSEAEVQELVEPLMSREAIEKVAANAVSKEQGLVGTLSDPSGMLSDAMGRFEEIPERWLKRAKELVREHKVEDARFMVPSEPNLDVVIVLHPTPQKYRGVDGEIYDGDHYVVFGREYQGTRRGTCYTCNNAQRKGTRPLPHNCWKNKTWEEWEPMVFAKAHGLDDAEDLAKELRSAWQATAEQKYGDNQRDWSAETEIPFSGDWQAGYLAGRGGSAWSTLG